MILRRARRDDSDMLLEWANSPESLSIKHLTHGRISRDAHERWFAERFDDPETLMFIAEQSGRPAGQVRLQWRGGAYEVDIFVVRDARRHGLAKMMIHSAVDTLLGERPGAVIRARVGIDNLASRRLFESLGFRKEHADGRSFLYDLAAPASGGASEEAR